MHRVRTFAVVMTVATAMVVGTGYAWAANEVVFSSSNGDGSGWTTGYSRFAGNMHGDLSASGGAKVYISGKIVFNNNSDDVCGRMTANVSGNAYQVVDGHCSGHGQLVGTPSGMEFRVCKDQFGPDPCGPWSAKSR